jgi:hypothetical protein
VPASVPSANVTMAPFGAVTLIVIFEILQL